MLDPFGFGAFLLSVRMEFIDKLQEQYPGSYRKGDVLLINGDCMDIMKNCPEKVFDLAIVDPPYGLGDKLVIGGKSLQSRAMTRLYSGWDNAVPNDFYFETLFICSKNQIIWGGNYFKLPPTRGIICWDKMQPWDNFSAWEMAWTSFDCVARLFKFDNRTGDKIHPTQKPVKLYEWLLHNYAKPGQKILDTHGGSMSNAIAAYYFGVTFIGIELDTDYYNAAVERFKRDTAQTTIFD